MFYEGWSSTTARVFAWPLIILFDFRGPSFLLARADHVSLLCDVRASIGIAMIDLLWSVVIRRWLETRLS